MTENRIAFTLTDAEQKQIADALQVIFSTLKSHTVVLSDVERKTLPKMADATLPFVEKVLSYTNTHPQFKPDYVNAADLAIDLNGYKLSNRFLASSNDLQRLLEDIAILSGSEAYMAALSYYRNVQVQARDNRPSAKAVYEDLQQRFINQSKKVTPKV
jgi:hypothetical protein